MVDGQAMDMAAEGAAVEGRALTEAEVLELMAAKTGALIAAAVTGGAIAATGSADGLDATGRQLGLAFQIADDLLDLTGDAVAMGKAVRKDAGAGKATLPSLIGIDEARRRADAACGEAIRTLDAYGDRGATLRALARFVVTRKR
jgi:geranylgeranyl pyrophosphate synthase